MINNLRLQCEVFDGNVQLLAAFIKLVLRYYVLRLTGLAHGTSYRNIKEPLNKNRFTSPDRESEKIIHNHPKSKIHKSLGAREKNSFWFLFVSKYIKIFTTFTMLVYSLSIILGNSSSSSGYVSSSWSRADHNFSFIFYDIVAPDCAKTFPLLLECSSLLKALPGNVASFCEPHSGNFHGTLKWLCNFMLW